MAGLEYHAINVWKLAQPDLDRLSNLFISLQLLENREKQQNPPYFRWPNGVAVAIRGGADEPGGLRRINRVVRITDRMLALSNGPAVSAARQAAIEASIKELTSVKHLVITNPHPAEQETINNEDP